MFRFCHFDPYVSLRIIQSRNILHNQIIDGWVNSQSNIYPPNIGNNADRKFIVGVARNRRQPSLMRTLDYNGFQCHWFHSHQSVQIENYGSGKITKSFEILLPPTQISFESSECSREVKHMAVHLQECTRWS
jgi:hypothetical protein